MKRYYKLIFYHIYKSLLKNDGHIAAKLVAIGVFSMIQAYNIATLLHLIDITLNYDFGLPLSTYKQKEIVIPGLLMIIFHY